MVPSARLAHGATIVSGFFFRRTFTGFGACRLHPFAEPLPLHCIDGRRPARLREQLRRHSPRLPGVYGMVNANGELIYVGKAKSLRARLLTYFRPGSRDPKAGRILEQTRRIVWEPAPSEFAALLRELELIRRWQPRCNVHGQPQRRRRTFLCVGRRPAPYAYLSARPPAGIIACYGPLSPGASLREAVRRLNDGFGLRDCPQKQAMGFADQGELFPQVRTAGCLRHDIGTCLGPCAAACTRDAYGEQVRALRSFLDGNDLSMLENLQREMTAASEALAFERAALLRDKHTVLQRLHERLDRLQLARERHTFIYPVAGHDGREIWYLIRRGWVTAAVAAPGDAASGGRAAEVIHGVFGPALPWVVATPTEEIDGILLVSAWFRRHPTEQARTLGPALALGRCL
jgi:excinuclease ABC subunit C